MQTIRLSHTTRLEGRHAATIGFFDGVHLGHQFLLGRLCQAARERGMRSMAVTFDRHPRQVLHSDWQPQLLTTLAEKQRLLALTGIDVLVVLPFSEEMAALSARDFMQQVLVRQLGVALLMTGYDNRFGHDRTETFADYEGYGRQLGIDVVAAPCYEAPLPLTPSSSAVRRLLSDGCVEQAAQLLGRPYTLRGTVVHGRQVGRQMGFPTANIEPEESCLLVPRKGVYAVRVGMGNSSERTEAAAGITNIGVRPTFGSGGLSIETHILGDCGDLYGQALTIAFIGRLRSEQAFDTPAELTRQMAIDAEKARQLLNL